VNDSIIQCTASLNSHLDQPGPTLSQNGLTATVSSHSGSHPVITAGPSPGRGAANTATGGFQCEELLLRVLPAAGESVFNWQVNTCLLKQEA